MATSKPAVDLSCEIIYILPLALSMFWLKLNFPWLPSRKGKTKKANRGALCYWDAPEVNVLAICTADILQNG